MEKVFAVQTAVSTMVAASLIRRAGWKMWFVFEPLAPQLEFVKIYPLAPLSDVPTGSAVKSSMGKPSVTLIASSTMEDVKKDRHVA